MSRRLPNQRVLLVEGDEDRRVIPYLVEANGLRWGERDECKLVDIESYDGVEKLLAPGQIETVLLRSNLRNLGILVDADHDSGARYRVIRSRCPVLPDLPDLPAEGVIAQDAQGRKVGVWLMPDNRSSGMLETFLALLRPAGPRRCGCTHRRPSARPWGWEPPARRRTSTRRTSIPGWPGKIHRGASSTRPSSSASWTRALPRQRYSCAGSAASTTCRPEFSPRRRCAVPAPA